MESINYSNDEKKLLILKNILKMLINRRWIEPHLESYTKSLQASLNLNDVAWIVFKDVPIKENDIYSITTPTEKRMGFVQKKTKDITQLVVKFISSRTSSFKKIPDIDQFVNEFKMYHKIFVVMNQDKIRLKKFISAGTHDIEVFGYGNLICNIIDHYLIPKHILLTKEESLQVIQEWHLYINKNHKTGPEQEFFIENNNNKEVYTNFNQDKYILMQDLPLIYINDPICEYYKAKKDDIFKIIRYDVNSGISIFYRKVVAKK
ncbi:putative DNA-dependent RNA polymerase subunit Rpb5 [Namao virus]|nr:putative DNA-dependent RNA polymerase subunit Rpb5 [Namao virus]